MRKLLSIIILPLYFFHILLYILSRKKNIIIKDLERIPGKKNWFGNDPIFKLVYQLHYNRYFRNLFYCRIGRISKIISWMCPKANTFIIGTKEIDEGFYAAHSFSTILNAKKIGKNFSCRHCTTIGNKLDGRNDLVPTIGDNVTVGANAVIIGNISIGNNVIIGAGSVIVKNIPSNCVVAGNPGKIISRLE